jgi:hypothetical protein
MLCWTITSAIATIVAAELTIIAILVAACIYKSARDHNYYIEILKEIKQFRIMSSDRIKDFRAIRTQCLSDLRINERLYNITKNVLSEEKVRYEDVPQVEGVQFAVFKDKYDILKHYYENYVKELITKYEALAVNYISLPHLFKIKFPLSFNLIKYIIDKYHEEIQTSIINQSNIPGAVFDLTGFNISRSYVRNFQDNKILPIINYLTNNILLYYLVNNELTLLCSRLLLKPLNEDFKKLRKYMRQEKKVKKQIFSLDETLTNYYEIYKDDAMIAYYNTFTNLNKLILKILSLKYRQENGMFVISGYVFNEEAADDNGTFK